MQSLGIEANALLSQDDSSGPQDARASPHNRNLEISESAIILPNQPSSLANQIMQSSRNQISPFPFRIEKELLNLPMEKRLENSANGSRLRKISSSIVIGNPANLRGKSMVLPVCIV